MSEELGNGDFSRLVDLARIPVEDLIDFPTEDVG
jgi:hypothetical protein